MTQTDDTNDDDIAELVEPCPSSPEPPVGYGVPPREHQYKPGQSGNLKGRPKGAQGHKPIAQHVLGERHKVREGDRVVERTILQIILLHLRQRALEGDTAAEKRITVLEVKHGPYEGPVLRHGVLIVPGRLTREEWETLYSPKGLLGSEELALSSGPVFDKTSH